jgi:hypothetical protein
MMETSQPYLCKINPQVLFQIVDYYERRSSINTSEKEKIPSRVIGTLLGSIDGGVVTLTSGYKVPHKEVEDEVAINMEFNENLYRLQKRVAPNEVIVGWFTTSKVIEEKDRLVQDYYHQLMSSRQAKGGVHPIVLMVDTAPTNGKVDIKVYTPLTLEVGKRETNKLEATLPLWLQTEICYSDADRTILDELRKCAVAPTRQLTIQSGIDPLKESVDEITCQLAVLQEYVQDVIDGKRKPNASTGRLLTDFFHSIPRADPEVFEKMLNSNVNDLLMVLYLSQLANVELSLNEKLVMAQ